MAGHKRSARLDSRGPQTCRLHSEAGCEAHGAFNTKQRFSLTLNIRTQEVPRTGRKRSTDWKAPEALRAYVSSHLHAARMRLKAFSITSGMRSAPLAFGWAGWVLAKARLPPERFPTLSQRCNRSAGLDRDQTWHWPCALRVSGNALPLERLRRRYFLHS